MLTGASLERSGIRGHRVSYGYTMCVLDLAIGNHTACVFEPLAGIMLRTQYLTPERIPLRKYLFVGGDLYQQKGCTGVQLGFLWYATLSARGHVFRPKRKGPGYTTRAITHCCTGSRQYGQIFMLAAQRSHAS